VGQLRYEAIMAATIKVTCPKCKKDFQAPDSVKGKKVRCKNCQEVFTVGAQDEEWGVIGSYPVGRIKDAPRCPFCAHDLDEEEQVICLNCGYNLLTRERHQTKVVNEVTGGDMFMWLLPGILCAIAALLLIGMGVCLWLPESVLDWGEFYRDWIQRGEFNKVYGSVALGFLIFYTARFAVKRLIFHPTPPETEKVGGDAEEED
jgi:hypothetical protein